MNLSFNGSNLREIRERRCLTLQELALRVGTTKGSVSRWELGHCRPNANRTLALADALSVNVSDFFTPRNQDSPPLAPFPKDTPDPAALPLPKPDPADALQKFDCALHELGAMIDLLCTAREEFVGGGEALTEARAELANTNLWAAELGLQHLHDAYRRWVDDQYKALKKEVK